MDLYEELHVIPDSIFVPFLQSVRCHSKAEERMIPLSNHLLEDHSELMMSKPRTHEEKYTFCQSLLVHMSEEEQIVSALLQNET